MTSTYCGEQLQQLIRGRSSLSSRLTVRSGAQRNEHRTKQHEKSRVRKSHAIHCERHKIQEVMRLEVIRRQEGCVSLCKNRTRRSTVERMICGRSIRVDCERMVPIITRIQWRCQTE